MGCADVGCSRARHRVWRTACWCGRAWGSRCAPAYEHGASGGGHTCGGSQGLRCKLDMQPDVCRIPVTCAAGIKPPCCGAFGVVLQCAVCEGIRGAARAAWGGWELEPGVVEQVELDTYDVSMRLPSTHDAAKCRGRDGGRGAPVCRPCWMQKRGIAHEQQQHIGQA